MGMFDHPLRRWEVAALLTILAAAAALRLAFLYDFRASLFFNHPVLDSLEYLIWAREIQGGRLLWDQVPIHSPLYAFFLAGLLSASGDSLGFVRTAQALLIGLGNCGVLWAMARVCAGRMAALISATFAATLWPLVYHDGEILVESPVLFLNALALFTLICARGRLPWLVLGGVLLGLSTIARPNAAAFVPVAAIWAFWPAGRPGGWLGSKALWRAATVRAAAVSLASALVIFPMVARNHTLSGTWMAQANGWLNFYIGNNAAADGTPNVRPGRPWARLNALASSRGITTPAERDAFYRRLAFQWWRQEPGRAVALFARKVALFWSSYEVRASQDIYYFRRLSPSLLLPWPGFGTLAPLALLGGLMALRRRSRERDLLLLYMCTYTLATAAFVVSGRYRLPVAAAAIPIAGFGAAALVEAAWKGPRRTAAAGLAMVVLLGLGVRQVPAEVIVRDNADERYNLGTILLQLGRYEEAEAVLRTAWEERQDDGRIATNLGVVLIKRGRAAESLPLVQEGVNLYPESQQAWNNLGAAAALLGLAREAEHAYQTSLALAPDHAKTHLAFGLFLLERGRQSAAVEHLAAARRLGAVLPPSTAAALRAEEARGRDAFP
jgi:tetratricopeptide (TPR) repeat protein